ncbi:putative phosphopantothenoylcysteine decarboxylase [Gracilariopsis chorda]|uniref:Putative phosphopantothenoylcysteine decarboxylase n=1 Tax=Gracilariopsis chorda TaxID=448386 RepID=A0A2V3IDJ9_9FLOR|nr:putative phosphopantothenoylcysteine decarboxylase [Gracilariopsis chorda]|eukprot:PXF40137.1 putative phosphopantothenoylcysteine decarboxylase [Gracilariopsis chorda]
MSSTCNEGIRRPPNDVLLRDQTMFTGKNVLLGISGSVAAIRTPVLVRLLQRSGATVQVIVTNRAASFIETESTMPEKAKLLRDEDEWSTWGKISDPVLHIELRKWADIFLVAPLSANTLAKLAHGLCDNLLTCVARAWPFGTSDEKERKPFFVAPAMNTSMWNHPVTITQLEIIRSFGVCVIEPISKKLACGDTGQGAMEEPEQIVSFMAKRLSV